MLTEENISLKDEEYCNIKFKFQLDCHSYNHIAYSDVLGTIKELIQEIYPVYNAGFNVDSFKESILVWIEQNPEGYIDSLGRKYTFMQEEEPTDDIEIKAYMIDNDNVESLVYINVSIDCKKVNWFKRFFKRFTSKKGCFSSTNPLPVL